MYYYLEGNKEGRRHDLTLKRGAPEYLNIDAPNVYRASDDEEIYHGWSMDSGLTGNETEAEAVQWAKFWEMTLKAFRAKYPRCA